MLTGGVYCIYMSMCALCDELKRMLPTAAASSCSETMTIATTLHQIFMDNKSITMTSVVMIA